MQAELQTVKEKMTTDIHRFMATLGSLDTLDAVQKKCKVVFEDLTTLVWPNYRFLLKSLIEPQSEAEEQKEDAEFADVVFQECTKFIDALRKYELVQEQEISEYIDSRSQSQQQIQLFKKMGQESSIAKVIDLLSAQILALGNELAGNRKLVGIIQLQIKAIFLDARTKFEIAPPLNPAQQQAVQQALQLKTRQVTVATTSFAGGGFNYEHPLKIDYNNPIEIVYSAPNC